MDFHSNQKLYNKDDKCNHLKKEKTKQMLCSSFCCVPSQCDHRVGPVGLMKIIIVSILLFFCLLLVLDCSTYGVLIVKHVMIRNIYFAVFSSFDLCILWKDRWVFIMVVVHFNF